MSDVDVVVGNKYTKTEDVEMSSQAAGQVDESAADVDVIEVFQRQHTIKIGQDPSDSKCCGRLKLLCCPVRSFANKTISGNDKQLEIELVPEAFRMWFYLYFILFVLLATFVTRTWGNTDFEDNPVLHQFGTNNTCVFFDDPPFSLFASTLWWPATIFIILYQCLDLIRIYDQYHDSDGHEISRCFYVYYTTSSFCESFCFIFFAQIFATGPTENLQIHTWPYFMLLYALWFMSFKRFLYFWKVGAFRKYSGLVYALGCVYIVLYLATIVIKVATGIPNLYGARLWETHPWTTPLVDINGNFYNFAAILVPVIVYTVMSRDITTITLTINRANVKR